MRNIAVFLMLLVLVGTSWAAWPVGVVINEVCYDPPGTDTGEEWIELYNRGDSAIPLDGYCLYASTEHYVFGSFTLNVDAYVVVHWNAEGTDSVTDLYTGTTAWSNMGSTSGSVALWNTHDSHTQETIVDFMEYGAVGQSFESAAVAAGIWAADDCTPDVDEGHSLEYKGLGNTSLNWFDQAVPTPGGDNTLPVELSSFSAKLTLYGVLLKWRTECEINNIGFNLYRIKDGELVKVNIDLIEGAGTAAVPHEYEYVDEMIEDGSSTVYVVETVAFDSETSRSEPIKVVPLLTQKERTAVLWGNLKNAK